MCWCADSCAAVQLFNPVSPRGSLEAGGVEKYIGFSKRMESSDGFFFRI